jgi:soluble lytic murein transglycosylase
MIKKTVIGILLLGILALAAAGGLSGALRGLEALMRPVLNTKIINRYCGIYKEDPYFIMSIIKVESNFLQGAKSSRGAVGLMQLMPSTAVEIAQDLKMKNYLESSLADPEINIQFGTYYVSKLRKELGDHDLTVLSAYNAGKKNVQEWKETSGRNYLEIGDIEFIETRNFSDDVLWNYRWLKRWQRVRNKLVKRTAP